MINSKYLKQNEVPKSTLLWQDLLWDAYVEKKNNKSLKLVSSQY